MTSVSIRLLPGDGDDISITSQDPIPSAKSTSSQTQNNGRHSLNFVFVLQVLCDALPFFTLRFLLHIQREQRMWDEGWKPIWSILGPL